MKPFIGAVESAINTHGMIPPGAAVCAAVSGGADSMSMLHALLELAPVMGFSVKACHYDHALRPESGEEADFVRKTAAGLGVDFTGEKDPSPSRRSVQARAREKRYAFFERLLQTGFADLIATGHTLDDTVETSIMWMLRGAGPSAFGGVRPVRGRFIRPLIDVRKADIVRWMDGRGLEYRHDPSNDTDAYTRNRVRHHIIPAMEREEPGAVEAIARLARITMEQSLFMEEVAQKRLAEISAASKDRVTLEMATLNRENPALRRVMFRLALAGAGMDVTTLSLKHVEAIDSLCGAMALGKVIDLPGGFSARADHAGLTLGRPSAGRELPETPFECPLDAPAGEGVLKVRPDGGMGPGWDIVDPARVPASAVFRNRLPGDYLRLKNMKGRKTLKTFLIDRKAPSGIRATMPLLASGQEILWAPGLFVSQKVSPESGGGQTVALRWER